MGYVFSYFTKFRQVTWSWTQRRPQ